MKQIKSIFFAALLLLGLAAVAQPQNPSAQAPPAGDQARPRHGMPSVDEQLKDLTDKLSLTADQQAKVKPILEDSHQQAQAVMNNNTLSRDDQRIKMRTLHESSSAKIRNILTDDQKTKFDAWQQEMRNRMHTRQGGEAPK